MAHTRSAARRRGFGVEGRFKVFVYAFSVVLVASMVTLSILRQVRGSLLCLNFSVVTHIHTAVQIGTNGNDNACILTLRPNTATRKSHCGATSTTTVDHRGRGHDPRRAHHHVLVHMRITTPHTCAQRCGFTSVFIVHIGNMIHTDSHWFTLITLTPHTRMHAHMHTRIYTRSYTTHPYAQTFTMKGSSGGSEASTERHGRYVFNGL